MPSTLNGRDGRDGRDGLSGSKGDSGRDGEKGEKGETGKPGLDACNAGTTTGGTYVRWGRTSCPTTAQLVYAGNY